jgi:hypothetical protein
MLFVHPWIQSCSRLTAVRERRLLGANSCDDHCAMRNHSDVYTITSGFAARRAGVSRSDP